MASAVEIEKEQMEKLYDLLMIRENNKGMKIIGLHETIVRAKASMKKENIAWVEQMIEEVKADM